MLDPVAIIKTVGIIGIILIIFFETGFLFGFFLPGDSLLFTAGLFASQGYLNIYVLITGCIIASILGGFFGYWTGNKYGRKLFEKEDGLLFKKAYLYKAEAFYEKHGNYTIFIARFVPFIRTFAPIVAGAARMCRRSFFSYNIFSGIFWAIMVPSLGYFLGNLIPNIDKFLYPIIILIIIVSVIPIILKIYKHKLKNVK